MLKNQNIIITGSAGRIGSAIGETFSKNGANIILIDREENIKNLIKQKEKLQRLNEQVEIYTCNLREVNEIRDVVNRIKEKYTHIDGLINNAGVTHLVPATQVTEEIWDGILEVNLKGTFFMSQNIFPLMVNHKSGTIINIGSQHGVVANKDRAPYGTSKAGIIHLTKLLALEWAKFGIRVNCISPTVVISDTNKEILNSAEYKREFLYKIPLKTYAEPLDIAEAALYLSSPGSRMITGHNLLVDGGWTLA